MNILLVHSHKLRKKNENYYTTGGMANQILHRYLKNSTDKLFLYTRCIDYTEGENLIQVNDEQIKCIPSSVYKRPIDYYIKHKQLKKEIKEVLKNIDFAIIRIPTSFSEAVYREVIKQKIPYVIEMVGDAWGAMWNYGSLSGKIMAPIRLYQVKKIVKNSENVVYVSEKFLQKRYPTKGNSIACSNVNISKISEEVLARRIEKIEAIEKHGHKYKIGLIGSLDVKYKGHKTAIKAVAEIRDKYNIELHFLGAGNKERWLPLIKKYKIEKDVFFDGILPAGEPVYDWMDKLDIILVPSITEGLPRALIEAMSRGCPAIGTRVGGIPELINENMICKKKDYKQIAKKIEYLIIEKDEMKKLACENFENSKKYLKADLDYRRDVFFKNILKNE